MEEQKRASFCFNKGTPSTKIIGSLLKNSFYIRRKGEKGGRKSMERGETRKRDRGSRRKTRDEENTFLSIKIQQD
jgi:hypothetical protein